MELGDIVLTVNRSLKKNAYCLYGDRIVNMIDRCEGNDIDLVEDNNKYKLSVTGYTEIYNTATDAIQGLIDWNLLL